MAQRFDVADYGAVPDLSDPATKSANRTAIQNTILAAIAADGIVVIGRRYCISKYVYVCKAGNLSILGESGGMLVHPSDDTNLNGEPEGGGALSATQHRSAIVIRDSSHVEVTGLGFQGGRTSNQNNIGAGVCITNSSWIRLENCYLDRGGRLFQQDSEPNDFGLTVLACKIYGAFSASNPGRQSLVSGCHFEQPVTTEYDRISNAGSSHALYIYGGGKTGGRENVRVVGNHFSNIRTTGVKVSGTSTPGVGFVIANNTFEDCGQAFEIGADDWQPDHSAFNITGNIITNSGTNRRGWNEGQACRVLGTRSVNISNNEFYCTRDNIPGSAGRNAIVVTRYSASNVAGAPVEQILINDNILAGVIVPTTSVWTASTPVALGMLIRANGYIYIATSAGTTGATAPYWEEATGTGSTRTDNGVTWRNQGPSPLLLDWTASTVMSLNDRRINANGYVYQITQAGTTGLAEPVWSSALNPGDTLTDGTVVWTNRGLPTQRPVAATAPHMIYSGGIDVRYVGQGSVASGAAKITDNEIRSISSVGIYVVENVGLVVENNTVANTPIACRSRGNRLMVVRDNLLIAGASTSSNAQLQLDCDSFPHIYGNTTQNRLVNRGVGSDWSVSASRGQRPVDFPLMGSHGRLVPTLGKPQVVFAYGAGWMNGDTVSINGTIFTYQHMSPGANEFNSVEGLIALINSLASYEALDYGAQFSPPVVTDHILVRWNVATPTVNRFFVTSTTQYDTAGVILANGNPSNALKCYSRGEQSGGAINSRTVVWSPMAHRSAAIGLAADNPAANTHLQANGWYVLRNEADSGADLVVEHTLALGGTEEFRWSLNG